MRSAERRGSSLPPPLLGNSPSRKFTSAADTLESGPVDTSTHITYKCPCPNLLPYTGKVLALSHPPSLNTSFQHSSSPGAALAGQGQGGGPGTLLSWIPHLAPERLFLTKFQAARTAEGSDRTRDGTVAMTSLPRDLASELWLPWNTLTICRGEAGRRTSAVWLDVPTSKNILVPAARAASSCRDGRERTLFTGTQVGMPSPSTLWEGNKQIRETVGMSTSSILLHPPVTFLSQPEPGESSFKATACQSP